MKIASTCLVVLVLCSCTTPGYVQLQPEKAHEISLAPSAPQHEDRGSPRDYSITMLQVAKEQGSSERVLFACTFENPHWPLMLSRIDGKYFTNDGEAQCQLQLEVDGEVIRALCPGADFSFQHLNHALEKGSHKIRLILLSTHGEGDLLQVQVTKIRVCSEVNQDFLARTVSAD